MEEVFFTVSNGYTLRTRQAVVREETAVWLLAGRRRRRLIGAKRNGDGILLTTYAAVCPHCGKEVPLCADAGSEASSPHQIDCFLTGQFSFFGDLPKELILQKPGRDPALVRCPRCDLLLPKSDGERAGSIRQTKKKILISLEVGGGEQVRWVKDLSGKSGPYTETLVFHLGRGKAYLTLDRPDGRRVAAYDITHRLPESLSEDPVLDALQRAKPLYRSLHRMLQSCRKEPLPFSAKELTVGRAILLTMFQGYDRTFYQDIPLTEEGRVEKSFSSVARQLRLASQVPGLLNNSALPRAKSLRRILCCRPALLFYLPELEKLWSVLGDLNYFTRLLSENPVFVFRTLAYLHRHPTVCGFLREYSEVVGKKEALHLMEDPLEGWRRYAPVYLTMSAHDRCAERKRWKNSQPHRDYWLDTAVEGGAFFSVPVTGKIAQDSPPECCTVMGFTFRRLSSTAEYREVGRALCNCLERLENFTGDVYGIQRSGHWYAAAEVCGKEILQARTDHNESFEKETRLYKAFLAWVDKYRLTWQTMEKLQ